MKNKKQNLFNMSWKVERFELLKERRPKSRLTEGAVFRFVADKAGDLDKLLVRLDDEKEFVEISSLLNISPTVFERDGVTHLVGIIGRDPCEFHRLIMQFGGFDDGKPWFKFEIIPVYDDCICLPDLLPIVMSGHGIGGGGGGSD